MSTERREKLHRALQNILHVLQSEYHPEKVILFGSLAENEPGQWSDIDLAIIKDTDLPFLDRLEEVALLCRAPVGVDYLVYTPEEFEQMIAAGNPFVIEEILNKGKVVYEREPAKPVA